MLLSSIFKKYLMALSGFVMVGFVFAHMLGNIQIFIGSDSINAYAHLLQNLNPTVKWGFRGFLALSLLLHVWMAILLTRENRAARPKDYAQLTRTKASLPSKTMGLTGSIILAFIVFHILHFTTKTIYPIYETEAFMTSIDGVRMHNVYAMMLSGFSHKWVAIFYVLAMGLLCSHLSHGVSSMFQSLGWRNNHWRARLDIFAKAYGWLLFIGFSSIPVAVLIGLLQPAA